MIALNMQPVEKLSHREDGSLDVVSVFKTIQGEGPLSGRPAIFIRLAGCNLMCPKCDTDYTSNRKLYTPVELLDAVYRVKQYDRIKLIVLTGGEPFRQYLSPFVSLAASDGFKVQIETNGTLYHDDVMRWYSTFNVSIICSPKTPKVHDKLQPYIDAWKYVLQEGCISKEDGLPSKTLGNETEVARPLVRMTSVYVQPLDEQDKARNELNTEAAIESCLKYGYFLSVQIHKVVGLE